MRPLHLAIITDGNGRWALQRGLPITAGHRAGAETVRRRLRDAADLGIATLTIYAFSTENWVRSREEIDGLMAVFREYVTREVPRLHREGVRMRFVGRRADPVPPDIIELMCWAEQMTAANTTITFCVPLNYGGRAEIVDAARTFTGSTEEEFRRHLYAPDLHDPDIVIRTSGERRLSNYLLWQSANAQLVFRDELWPDFSAEALREVVEGYRSRQPAGPLSPPSRPAA